MRSVPPLFRLYPNFFPDDQVRNRGHGLELSGGTHKGKAMDKSKMLRPRAEILMAKRWLIIAAALRPPTVDLTGWFLNIVSLQFTKARN
jgi:hypothetical protein